MKKLWHRIQEWWTFRDVRGYDPSPAAAGDRRWLLMGTDRRFKQCLSIEVTRDDLALLAEMIQDMERDGDRCCGGDCDEGEQ